MTQLLLTMIDTVEQLNTDPTVNARVSELQKAVARHTSNFPSRPPLLRSRSNGGDVVLVTGTTGGFGCHILAQLSQDPTVRKVYAFNRPSEDMVARQLYAMQKQGLLEECLRHPKFELLEGDLRRPDFGLDPATYDRVRIFLNNDLYHSLHIFIKLRDSVTHVIHNGAYVREDYRTRCS